MNILKKYIFLECKPLNLQIYDSCMNDSKILNLQLEDALFFKRDNTNILLGDKGYDSGKQKFYFCFPTLKNKVYFILFSKPIRDKLKKIKFGRLIAPKNIRNCKDPILLKTYKLCNKDKKLLKHRIKIENSFAQLKAFKRVNIRYDKNSKHYFNYVILAALSFY